jgi:cyclic lactone autoinducer peptide
VSKLVQNLEPFIILKIEEIVKMKKTNLIARTIAKVALIAVKEASGTASWYGSYQPKEPKKLNEYINKRKTK